MTLAMMAVLTTLLTGCGGEPSIEWELKISGDVSNPVTLTFQDLAAMTQTEFDELLMEKSTGDDLVTSWSGPSIADLVKRAGAPPTYSSVTAIAADGYAVEITYDEMTSAIVALKDHGEWIAEVTPDKGPIRLVCPRTPGNRWVYQLIELQIHQ